MKNCEKFWYITGITDVPDFRDIGVDYEFYEDWMGDFNVFRTKNEASRALSQIKKILSGHNCGQRKK